MFLRRITKCESGLSLLDATIGLGIVLLILYWNGESARMLLRQEQNSREDRNRACQSTLHQETGYRFTTCNPQDLPSFLSWNLNK